MNTIEQEAELRIELEQFCKFEGLPPRCATELIHEDVSDGQRQWLSDFLLRWEACEERMRIQRKLYALAMQQLGRVQASTNVDDDRMETADDGSIIAWMDDLRDRIGLDVQVVKSTLQTFIGVRSGTMDSKTGAAYLQESGEVRDSASCSAPRRPKH